MKKDYLGEYVVELDKFGFPVDTDVSVNVSVHGSFRVKYYDDIDKISVKVEPNESSAYTAMSMHLTLEQAAALRDMLDAAMSDYIATHVASPLTNKAGGR